MAESEQMRLAGFSEYSLTLLCWLRFVTSRSKTGMPCLLQGVFTEGGSTFSYYSIGAKKKKKIKNVSQNVNKIVVFLKAVEPVCRHLSDCIVTSERRSIAQGLIQRTTLGNLAQEQSVSPLLLFLFKISQLESLQKKEESYFFIFSMSVSKSIFNVGRLEAFL